ncbi:hypothetical protein TL16_g05146 [Triparma laevis f. inornata]|uniref:Uncharacterized protein n=1 Tax=Triparma laevis f. inornata TaxID=1714386 RepID=A0A9W7EAW9_9STRA|nr:hypothetical protein TL16_g05146 [Triparma laevis f. inornata]
MNHIGVTTDAEELHSKKDVCVKTAGLNIHEVPNDFLTCLLGDHPNINSSSVHQEVIDSKEDGDTLLTTVCWSFFIDPTKKCEMFLRLQVAKNKREGGRDDDEIRIDVSSVEIDEDKLALRRKTRAPSPHAPKRKTTKTIRTFRLLLQRGVILLRTLPFKQTSFTFRAEVGLGKELEERRKTTLSVHHEDHGVKPDELFDKLATLFYERFKKEEIVDERMKQDFIEKIPKAPNKTEAEIAVIRNSMELITYLRRKAPRVPHTVNDPVEKFFYRDGDNAWGKTRCRIDCAATYLFASLWLLQTHYKKKEHIGLTVKQVWEGIDGTRGLQFVRSLSLHGATDRIFNTWITWDELEVGGGGNSKRAFVIVISPIEEYKGTKHKVSGAEKMKAASTRGVYIIKELTWNTCEWTSRSKVLVVARERVGFLSKQELSWANVVQEKFKRNEKEVDRERVAFLAEKMRAWRGKPLKDDQEEVLGRCLRLLEGEEEWQALEGRGGRGVEMWMQYIPPKKGEKSLVTGKAIGVLDCSAEEVAAWAVDYCNNEKMRISRERGNPARLMLTDNVGSGERDNEAVAATVKKFPFFLQDREFVAKFVWKSEEGRVYLAVVPEPREVDYGVKLRKVRGSTYGLWVMENLPSLGGPAQCHVTFVQRFNFGGIIPKWIITKKLPKQLEVLENAMDEFMQDEKMDEWKLRELSTTMKILWESEEYGEEEEAVLKRGMEFCKKVLERSDYKVLNADDPRVSLRSAHLENDKLVTGIAEAVVDADLEQVAAWEYLKNTRESVKAFVSKGGVNRFVKKINNHTQYYEQTRDFKFLGLRPREWRSKVIWKKATENRIVIVYEDTTEMDKERPRDGNVVGASTRTAWVFERLGEVEGIAQTKVTFVSRGDFKGGLPTFIMNKLVKNLTKSLIFMRVKFDQSLEIDAATRGRWAKLIEERFEAGGRGWGLVLGKVDKLFSERDGMEAASRSYGGRDESKVLAGKGGAWVWGKTNVEVRGAVEEVAAFFWDFESRASTEIGRDEGRVVVEESVDGDWGRKVVRRGGKKAVFLNEMALHCIDEDCIVVLIEPSPAGLKAVEDLNVNKETAAVRFKRVFGGSGVGEWTKLEYAVNLEFGAGGVDVKRRKALVERRLEVMAVVSIYFQRLVRLEDYGVKDGLGLAHDLLWRATSSKKRVKRMKEVVEKSRGLRELILMYPWFEAMLTPALEGHLHMNHVVRAKLDCLSVREAAQIGKNLIPSLKSKKLAEAGVDQWKVQNRAVNELADKNVWFLPMISLLARGIVKSAAWGLMWRVSFGAVLSVTDLATDLIVLKQFWDGGEETRSYRDLSLSSIGASIFLQLLIVMFQNRRKGYGFQIREMLIVLSGMKAPWDAYRVASGAEKVKGTEFDPLLEMTLSKYVELFAESIPGILIQLSAILQTLNNGGEVSALVTGSLFISTLTTGLVSTTISYDFDTDPAKRSQKPDFYGYVPASPIKRSLIFAVMILISSCLVFVKSLLLLVLSGLDRQAPIMYLGLDVGFFVLYKVLRGDFIYWIPVSEISLQLIVALGFRLVCKFVTDFTGCVHYRHPYELGGMYYSVNFFQPLLVLVGLVLVDMEGISGETTELAGGLVGMLGPMLVCLVVVFFLSIDKKYLGTFFSTETGAQMTQRIFLTSDSDLVKSQIFKYHRRHWVGVKVEIGEWLEEGWDGWEEERPDWFTEDWKGKVKGIQEFVWVGLGRSGVSKAGSGLVDVRRRKKGEGGELKAKETTGSPSPLKMVRSLVKFGGSSKGEKIHPKEDWEGERHFEGINRLATKKKGGLLLNM